MNVCIPVLNDDGLESTVSGHFGSAPGFLIVDTSTRACRRIVNTNAHHAHGGCQPLALLSGQRVDAFVVGGIGGGALAKILAGGVKVYRATAPTVKVLVEALAANQLPMVSPDEVCQGHHG